MRKENYSIPELWDLYFDYFSTLPHSLILVKEYQDAGFYPEKNSIEFIRFVNKELFVKKRKFK